METLYRLYYLLRWFNKLGSQLNIVKLMVSGATLELLWSLKQSTLPKNTNTCNSCILFRILLHKRLKIKSEVNNINQSCVKSSTSLKLSLTDSGIESPQTKTTQSSVSDGSHKKTKVCTLLWYKLVLFCSKPSVIKNAIKIVIKKSKLTKSQDWSKLLEFLFHVFLAL